MATSIIVIPPGANRGSVAEIVKKEVKAARGAPRVGTFKLGGVEYQILYFGRAYGYTVKNLVDPVAVVENLTEEALIDWVWRAGLGK